MKILLFYAYYPSHISSAEKLIVRLVDRLEGQGHEVVLAFSKKPVQEFLDALKAKGLHPKIEIIKISYLGYLLSMMKLLLKERPKIAHGNFVTIYFPINLIGYLTGTRFVYHFHGPYPEEIGLGKKIIYRIISRLFNHKIVKIIFVSDYVRKKHMQFYNIKDNLIRIYNGVEVTSVKANRKKYGIEDEFVLSFVGHVHKMKGLTYLFRALRKLDDTKIKLLVAGDGVDLAMYRKMAKGLNVQFLGNISNVSNVLASSDISITPSIVGEGLAYGVMEAMAQGKAVISTPVGGIPEMIEHNKTGILIRPKDEDAIIKAILKLKNNKRLREKFGKAAQKKVEKDFKLKKTVEEHLNVYKEILG